MNAVWIIPAVAAVLAVVVCLVLVRQARDAATELGEEIRRFGEVQPALDRLRADAAAVRQSVAAHRRT